MGTGRCCRIKTASALEKFPVGAAQVGEVRYKVLRADPGKKMMPRWAWKDKSVTRQTGCSPGLALSPRSQRGSHRGTVHKATLASHASPKSWGSPGHPHF